MKIETLGPLTAQVDGAGFVPSAAKPRQMLALLALQGGRVVPVPVLMEEVWGENPPRSATATLQTHPQEELIRCPYDGREVGRIRLADGEAVEAAIRTAVSTYGVMRRLPRFARADILARAADAIQARGAARQGPDAAPHQPGYRRRQGPPGGRPVHL